MTPEDHPDDVYSLIQELGPCDPKTGHFMLDEGNLLAFAGRIRLLFLQEQDALTGADDHPDTAMIRNNIMTILCVNRVRPAQARAILKSCLSRFPATNEGETK